MNFLFLISFVLEGAYIKYTLNKGFENFGWGHGPPVSTHGRPLCKNKILAGAKCKKCINFFPKCKGFSEIQFPFGSASDSQIHHM